MLIRQVSNFQAEDEVTGLAVSADYIVAQVNDMMLLVFAAMKLC